MKAKNVFNILSATILISSAFWGMGCGENGGRKISVTVDTTKVRNIIETVSASGKIQPEVELKISSDVSGQIVELYVQEGDSVKQGQLLLIINPDLYESEFERVSAVVNQTKANVASAKSQMEQAKAQFIQAEANWKRNKDLYERKVLSKSEWEQIDTQFEVAKSQYEASKQSVTAAEYTFMSAQASQKSAKDNLSRTKIYAPMSGTVSKLSVEKGERVVGTAQMQGTEMLRIANLREMEVVVDINENDIVKVDLGDTAYVEVDAYLNRKFVGVVRQIANSPKTAQNALATDEVTNFEVKISILRTSYDDLITQHKSSPFRPGMSATVEVVTDRKNQVLSAPIQSVTTRKDTLSKESEAMKQFKEFVFVVDGKKAVQKEVKTGIQDNHFIEIVSGIESGTILVEGPYQAISKTLSDGANIRITDKQNLYKDK
ncbi:MAG: efflux RND transporter periplasmic adaptor subunit [Flavobacteriales bacterium]|nr:efflux RND transporter periplasmic adaptor subunit [Flavobacteriales bacterium]